MHPTWVRAAVLCVMVSWLGYLPAVASADQEPCEQIKQACLSAGFVAGQAGINACSTKSAPPCTGYSNSGIA